ncbi:MAG: methyltransferase domain-containing protein [Candidatus Latescibacteria bacterium]|nr:methyltransferase domain-containing protein [Candidatus Latescibacterota bacterium]
MTDRFRDPAGLDEWLAGLDQRWPARAQVIDHLVEQVRALNPTDPKVVELAAGAGNLGAALLEALPQASYTAVDFSAPLLERAQARLNTYQQVQLVQADLNEDEWLKKITAPVDAVLSLQALHDLGDEPQVERIYRLAHGLLRPGGLLINADLLHNPEDPRPGRLSTERHLELMRHHGYGDASCTLATGGFGCCVGVV